VYIEGARLWLTKRHSTVADAHGPAEATAALQRAEASRGQA
jgi:hypothetical protein